MPPRGLAPGQCVGKFAVDRIGEAAQRCQRVHSAVRRAHRDAHALGFESRRVAWPRRVARRARRRTVRALGRLHALRVRIPARGVATGVVAERETVRGGEVGRIGGLKVNKRARNFSARETFGLGMFVLCETLGIGSCPFDSSDSLREPKWNVFMTRRKRKGGGRERGVERRGRPLINTACQHGALFPLLLLRNT